MREELRECLLNTGALSGAATGAMVGGLREAYWPLGLTPHRVSDSRQPSWCRYFANFQNDPGYIAARDAGIAGIEQSQAGPGMLHSGGTLKALQDYGQRLMWSQFQNRLEGLRGLGVQGQNAATTQGGWQTQFGRDKADMLGQIGTARASGIVGAANAGTAGTQNMLQLAGYGIGAASNYANRNDLANYFKSQQAPTTG